MAIDASEVVSQFGPYYIDQGQNINNLLTPILAPSETELLFNTDARVLTGENTVMRNSTVDITDVLQGYQDTYTAFGDTTFEPREIDLYEFKIDWAENPSKLEASWLGFLTNPNIDRTEWPIIRWLLEMVILPKSADNYEKKAIFNGIKANPTTGTAQSAGSAMNGLRKQMNDAVTASDLTPITMGAVPTDPVAFVEYVEAFVQAIDSVVRPSLDCLVMSRTLAARFKQGMKIKYNMYYAAADIAAENNYGIPIKGVISHEGSTKIWTTFAQNRVRGVKKPGNASIFKVENVDRIVKAYTDFWKGIGIWDWRYFYTNDVDLSYGQ